MRSFAVVFVLLSPVVTGHVVLGQQRASKSLATKRLPVIDMHIHSDTLDDFGGGEISVCLGDGKLVLTAIDPKLPFEFGDVVK